LREVEEGGGWDAAHRLMREEACANLLAAHLGQAAADGLRALLHWLVMHDA
jgi:hypothetical protein